MEPSFCFVKKIIYVSTIAAINVFDCVLICYVNTTGNRIATRARACGCTCNAVAIRPAGNTCRAKAMVLCQIRMRVISLTNSHSVLVIHYVIAGYVASIQSG